MCCSTFDNLGNEDSIVSLDVLVAYTSSDAKSKPCINGKISPTLLRLQIQ